MPISQDELAAFLRHCRALVDVADDVQGLADRRAEEATRALRAWRGPHAQTFRARVQGEDDEARHCASSLRREADVWAELWADALNEENRRRHEAAVEEMSSRRGIGEQFVDLFVGDDSADQVGEFVPVAVPVAHNRYAPTGHLMHYR